MDLKIEITKNDRHVVALTCGNDYFHSFILPLKIENGPISVRRDFNSGFELLTFQLSNIRES